MNDDEQMQLEIIKNIDPSLLPQTNMDMFRQKLAEYIHQLINTDFNKLVHILYRLDINEKKLKELLASSRAIDAGYLIAGMIIERQLQKIKLRKEFSKRNDSIAEEDKW